METKNRDYFEPDRDLLNWEKWIKIRKEEIEDIGQRLNRAPVDMIMNQSERVRENKEWKSVLQNAQIDKKTTVRGSLWERPDRLKQTCYCEPVYEVHRTREEIGRPRVIEHIGVPQHILENEKGIQGIPERNKCMRLDKQFIKYKEKREEDLQEKIKKIDPFTSEISELFIKGNKPKMATKTLPLLPEITITPTKVYYSEELSTVYALRINNTIFIKDTSAQSLRHLHRMQKEKWHEACSSWLYYFNVPVKRVGRAKLFLQNLGTVSLRYCWKKIIEQIPFISDDGLNQVFYFNKNEDVLNPGQSREIFFTFVSSTVGIYNESWELSFVNVSFFDNLSKKPIVNLQADTVEDIESIRKKIDILKVRLNRKAVRKLIKTLLNNAVETATYTEPQVCPYKQLLLESELFKMKNPFCCYHQTEVMKLKDFYSEMIPGEIWDLSITTWRDVMMKKDFDDRMKYYNILKQSYTELMKPWNESDNLLWQKHVAVKFILSQLANKFDEVYAELKNVINEIEPSDKLFHIPSGTPSGTAFCNKQTMVQMVFHMRMYDHIKMAVEACAGVVSSIDANRWIKFDFCQV